MKAFLIHTGGEFAFTHNLAKLVEACARIDADFKSLLPVVEPLTPYAVELRYDAEFWPSREVAEKARAAAQAVRDFVLERLPPEMMSGGS